MKSAKGTFKNLYALRFEPGEDVMLGLQKFCEDHGIGHGVILSAIGSLQGCSFFDPEELPGKPGLYGYGDPIELPCPIELISMGGIICTEQDGKISCMCMPPLLTSPERHSAGTSKRATAF